MPNFIQKLFSKKTQTIKPGSALTACDSYPDLTQGTDNVRFFVYANKLSLINDNSDLIEAIYEKFSTLDKESFEAHIYPLIDFFASHMSIVPASQGCHDSYSGGLFRHSLQVAALALDFYHTDNIFAKRRSDYDNLFIDERALFILSMLHDFTKIVTDMDIYAGDKCYNFFSSTLDLFLKKYLRDGSYIKIVFRDKRGVTHDNVQIKAIVCSLLLSRLDNLIPLLAEGYDPLDLLSFDNQNPLHYATGICDKSMVRQTHTETNLHLLRQPLSLKAYLRMCVINLIKGFSYEVNSLNSHLFVTNQGIVFASCSQPFIDLLMFVHEHNSGSEFSDDSVVLEPPTNLMRKAGILKLYGSNKVMVYHRLDLYDCTIYVKGLMFLTDTSDLYTLDCHVCDNKDLEISALLKYFADKNGAEPEIIKVKARSSLPYYLDESVLDKIEVQYLSLEQNYVQYEKDMSNTVKRRYSKKMRAISSMVTQAEKLSLIDIQRELELMQQEQNTQEQDESTEHIDTAVQQSQEIAPAKKSTRGRRKSTKAQDVAQISDSAVNTLSDEIAKAAITDPQDNASEKVEAIEESKGSKSTKKTTTRRKSTKAETEPQQTQACDNDKDTVALDKDNVACSADISLAEATTVTGRGRRKSTKEQLTDDAGAMTTANLMTDSAESKPEPVKRRRSKKTAVTDEIALCQDTQGAQSDKILNTKDDNTVDKSAVDNFNALQQTLNMLELEESV